MNKQKHKTGPRLCRGPVFPFPVSVNVSGPCPLQQDPHMEGEIEHNQRQNNAQQNPEEDSHSMSCNLPQ